MDDSIKHNPLARPGSTIGVEHIQFTQAWPVKHMHATGGLLPETKEAAALWNFLLCAFQALHHVESQKTLIGNEDQVVSLRQIATSQMKIFGITDMNELFNAALIQAARREAIRCGLFWDTRIDAYFETGGNSYSVLDRDADKL